jgi:hypothetical protein
MPNTAYKTDVDGGFIGFDSRTNPALLKPQMLQYAENIRIFRGEAQKRLGLERVDDNSLSDGEGVPYDIFSSCQYVTQDGVEKIALATAEKLIIYTPTTDTYNIFSYPAGRTITENDNCVMLQALSNIYIFRGLPEEQKEVTLTNNTAPYTTVTGACTAHGYAVGDEIVVSSIDPAAPIDSWFTVSAIIASVANANTFTYIISVPAGHHANIDGIVQRAKPTLVWAGTGDLTVVEQGVTAGLAADMPPSDIAIYHGNRIILKTDRNNIAVSDFLDFAKFDLTFGQFTINQGANDYIVGITPWMQDEFIVFQRNSIYIGRVINTNYELGDGATDTSYLNTLTNSFGAVSRRTIINTGRIVFFLSDAGVFGLEPQLDLRLINTLEPLSSPIDNIIKDIREDLVDKAVGVYFDNRLFLAVPIDGEEPTTGNNKVLIYNIINKAWESVDTFFEGFCITDFVICQKDKRKRLYATSVQPSSTGDTSVSGFCLWEENEIGDENTEYGIPRLPKEFEDLGLIDGVQTYGFYLSDTEKSYYPIESIITTRKMVMETSKEKRFSSVNVDAVFEASGEFQTVVKIFNPDQEAIVDTAYSPNANDVTRRVGIARRGYAAETSIISTMGRPIIRGISVDATVAGRSNKSTE